MSEKVPDAILATVDELEAEGKSYIKSRDVAARAPFTARQAGRYLRQLEGDRLELWGSEKAGMTWRLI